MIQNIMKILSKKEPDIYADNADSPNLVVINGNHYYAVEDTESEMACAGCALLTQDCGPVKCDRDERTDGRDVIFKPCTP